MEFLETKQSLERMCKDRRYAKMEEGREKFAAKGEVIEAVGSGPRIPQMETERLSAETILVKSEVDEKVLSMEETVDDSQKRKDSKRSHPWKRLKALKWKENLLYVKWVQNSSIAEKKSGDTCGISRDTGLRFGNQLVQVLSQRKVAETRWTISEDRTVERADGGKKVFRSGMEQHLRTMWTMWEYSSVKTAWDRAVLSTAEKERQEGTRDNWQTGSSFKEELELVKRSSDLNF